MNDQQFDGDDVTFSSTWNWKIIAAGVVALLTIVFVLQNRAESTIYFLFFEATIGVWVALLVAFGLGLALGLLLPRLIRGGRRP
jgi:uncharacterized integral membrane protein